MRYRYSYEVNPSSVNRQISRILCNSKVYCWGHRRFLLVSVLNQMKSVHNLLSISLRCTFKISSHLRQGLPSCSFLQLYTTRPLYVMELLSFIVICSVLPRINIPTHRRWGWRHIFFFERPLNSLLVDMHKSLEVILFVDVKAKLWSHVKLYGDNAYSRS
jgi:hypothetical protein